MNSPFVLKDIKNKVFTVSWPTYNDIREVETKIRLLDTLFKLNMYEVGLVIQYNQDELDIMWINQFAFLGHPEIDQYMFDHYQIIGVAFHDVGEAESFKEWLDKKLVWKILND